ncbi:MAG: glutaredoxin domain-containing protein [Candidatus ainarchaeum sp.]|nr:glutaredoxin domain-containing protein [Candidatus ainarchaeum sp.]
MKKVIVYSTDTCPFCTMAKDFLKSKKIKFEEFNVAENEAKLQEMLKKSGQTGVPVIDIAGEIITGFDKERIENALGLK